MRSLVTRVCALVALSFSILPTVGCGGPPPGYAGPGGPGPGGPGPGPGPGAGGGGAKACDPKGCNDYCYYASCLYDIMDTSKCIAACTSRCGDGYFDDMDAKVMACAQAAGMTIDCSGQKACCAESFTSQLCQDVDTHTNE